MPKSTSYNESDKGTRVEITGGSYVGLFGWKHLTANTFADKAWIIVEAGTTKKGKAHPVQKTHLLSKESFCEATVAGTKEPPETFELALLADHPDIKRDLQNIAKKLASVKDLDPKNGQPMLAIFWKMWIEERKKFNRLSVKKARFVNSWATNPNNIQANEMATAKPAAKSSAKIPATKTTLKTPVATTTVDIVPIKDHQEPPGQNTNIPENITVVSDDMSIFTPPGVELPEFDDELMEGAESESHAPRISARVAKATAIYEPPAAKKKHA